MPNPAFVCACLLHVACGVADQLNVRAGLEFIAARKTLIELLKQQQQQQAAAGGTPADGDDDGAAAAAAAAASGGQPAQQQRQQPTWLQMCVAADRPVMSTLTGLWGALGPWKRLELLCGVAWMLLWKVRGQGSGVVVGVFQGLSCWMPLPAADCRSERFRVETTNPSVTSRTNDPAVGASVLVLCCCSLMSR